MASVHVQDPWDKIGEPEDINIDVSQSRVTVRNADQQLSIALLGTYHLKINRQNPKDKKYIREVFRIKMAHSSGHFHTEDLP